MADKWMDDREEFERAREADWRRTERTGRDGLRRYPEPRSFDDGYEGDGGYEGGRDAVFGAESHDHREPGAGRARGGWQDPEYGGVSPAMRRGGYGPRAQGRGYRAQGRGGRFYGDDARETIYREEYGVTDFGYRDPRYSPTRADYHAYGYGEPGFDYGYDPRMLREMRRPGSAPWAGGNGGYDYERGYGDGGRGERPDRGERFERAGRSAGQFLHRAGEKVAEWFAAGSEARAYDPEIGRPHARGLGPKGYKRADERISDDAHERLTDDAWVDASEIAISVSGGEATLSGTVTSREAKHRAERIVEDIPGVNHVQNNLRIARPGFLRGDSTGYGDAVSEAQMRRDDPIATSTTGEGGGQSTAGRKN